jgi:hypothetical protein
MAPDVTHSADRGVLVCCPRRGEACITTTRADVATLEEACFATLTSASRASPLTAILHAGAVLDSAVISNISLAGLRTEFRYYCAVPVEHEPSRAFLRWLAMCPCLRQ